MNPRIPPHHVRREELLDWQTYDDSRDMTRKQIIATKQPRRLHLGRYLTFLFENHDTIRYQIQEMMRVERIVRESSIQEELDTYNSLLGGPGQLGCTLLIEIEDEAKRQPLLEAWINLPNTIYAAAADEEKRYAEFDLTQIGRGRLSSVQYLTFSLDDPPIVIGCDLPDLAGEILLDQTQQIALAHDLAATRR